MARQVRSCKVGSIFKSIHKKADAIACAKIQQVMMKTGEWKPKKQQFSTLGYFMRKNLNKVTPHKKGAEPEMRCLKPTT